MKLHEVHARMKAALLHVFSNATEQHEARAMQLSHTLGLILNELERDPAMRTAAVALMLEGELALRLGVTPYP